MMMEGGSSHHKKSQHIDLTDLVFSWSLEDIFSENLYKHQVERIPTSFESVEQYLGSFIYPLLEETREELASTLEIMHWAPFAEVNYIEEDKRRGTSLYHVKVDYWKNRFGDRGKEPYRTLPGDILVFSDIKPETASDLQHRTMWTFGSVFNITEDDNGDGNTCTNFTVKVSKDIEVKDRIQRSQFVVYLTNITTNKRIWNTLHVYRNLDILKKVLYAADEDDGNCDICCVRNNNQLADIFDASVMDLNKSQTEAVLGSLDKMICDHKTSVELIWGPPGTGKTKTMSVMLFVLLKMKLRTLVCAPTNVAITEAASRLIKLLTESVKAESGENDLFCSYGEMLLFGNKDRLKFDSDIENIYLEYRADRLIECLGPLTGWRHCLSSMISFLEDCVSQYNIYMENELIKSKEQSNKDEFKNLEYKSFLEFARARFRYTVSPLRRCIFIFCTHLPRSFLGESTFQDFVTLSQLLDSLEKKLFQDNAVSEELEKLLLQKETVEHFSDSSGDASLMLCFRSQSLSILQRLRHSLEILNLPSAMNKDVVMEFCFQRASVIFCTASGSYKLRKVKMEPLKLLVIDEAAQLKECESTIPLQLLGMRHTILIGDECQLPATVKSTISAESGFGRSLFERLSLLDHSKHLLNIQYRMHPSISFYPNLKFYQNQIFNAQNVQSKNYEKIYLPGSMFGPYSFINIVGGKEEMDDVGYSRRNMVEVAVVTKIIQDLFKECKDSKRKLSVGVISPYAGQVVAIQDKIGRKYEKVDGFSLKVKSIDGFQGGEEDIVIISTVRSNNSGSIGFISSPQRTNVALTRARHSLWILGNERTLANGDSIWGELIQDAKNRNCFFNADENKNLAKSILDVKKELDQLDDLLNSSSVLFRSSRWKVSFSDNFRKSFGKLVSGRMKKSVLNLLLKLSSGWRPKNWNVDTVCESSSQILKMFKVEGLYVVCTIDIVKESKYKQVLKVWDILPLEEIPKLVKRLDSIFSMYTDDFINHCKEIFFEGTLEIPKSWDTSKEIIRYKKLSCGEVVCDYGGKEIEGRSYVENSRVNDSLLLMKFYALSSGVVNHLLSNRDSKEYDLPFEVTDEEMDIILFDKSSFILGRSGTGKTTVLTMKLFQKEECYSFASEGNFVAESSTGMDVNQKNEGSECLQENTDVVLRQLFVTVSPKLCYAVKQQVSHLKSFSSGGSLLEDYLIDKDATDDAVQFKDVPDSFIKIPSNVFPLVITFRKFLVMLDGTLGNSYFERFHDVREYCCDNIRSSNSVALQAFIRTKEVNYDRFCSNYWPHFNAKLTKKLDPSRVFTEIISHIKGGLQVAQTCDSKLGRQEYLQLAECRVSTLSRPKRERIYDIFQDYEKMKLERGEYDLADLVIDLHLRLRNTNFEGHKMDFVYIDEVQDLTMRQISLFKYICRNDEDGFVFSGDTAQTIARGIDFRFQDIRSLFYKVFMESESDGSAGRKDKGRISEIFNLRQNFRTHDGVLKLAQSVIDLLYRFFHHFVDVLKPETSLIYGEAPVLLEPGNDENAIVTIFGNSGSVEKKIVGFGAEQVILVRDDSARDEILKYVGKHALVLTIVECKGLEFQDVLLYNFFGSSPLKSQWRVVYEFMNEQDLLDATCPMSFPSFSESRHNLLCSELKQLYVAITRTRQRLWISENTEELSKPMFDYWRRKCLVQIRKLDDSLAQAMQVASSPEEWKARGVKLFLENNYEMATICFERAGDTTWEKRSKASGLKTAADRMRDSNPKVACTFLREAAEIFDSIGKAESAAICYYDLGDFETAGRIYRDKCGDSELKKAAECFTLAGSYDIAAEIYARGRYFSECLSACTKAKLYDLGLKYIDYWKQHDHKGNSLDRSKGIEEIEQEFLERCAHNYNELKDKNSMMKFVKAFRSMDSRRSFLKSIDCLEELLFLEEESGNYVEAAEIARLRGDILQEADLRGKAGQLSEASSLILWYVACNSLWINRSEGWPLKQFTQKGDLLLKAKIFAKKESQLFYELVCTEVNILSHERSNLVELNKYLRDSQKHSSLRGQIFSLRKILDAHFSLNASKYEWENELPLDCKEQMLSESRASITTIVHFWNLWQENIVNVFEYLDSVETQNIWKFTGHGEFCMNYLGIRRQFNNFNNTFLLMIPDAEWLRKIDERTLRKGGNLLSADSRQFVSSARRYWQSEFLSVGMKTLQTLDALHKFTIKNSSVFVQSRCFVHIFEVAKCLMDCKYLELNYHNRKILNDFVDLSTKYFLNVFPLDWRMSSSENLVSLRVTRLSRMLLEEVVLREVSNKRKMTYGQIGKVVMAWLETRKPTELHQKILKSFEENIAWKAFIENFSKDVDGVSCENSEIQLVSRNHEETSREVSLLYMFHRALEETYRANWRLPDYISPPCFLYLVDRLLFVACYFKGFFFTIRSSLVEWILCQHSNTFVVTSTVVGNQFSLREIFDFLADIVRQLLYNTRDTSEWIKISKININVYFPLLVLKLFVILCLLCLNCKKYYDLLSNLLRKSDVTYLLPREFLGVLKRSKKGNYIDLKPNLLSEALSKIGDPLVTVSLVRSVPDECRVAMFLDMGAIRCKDDIFSVLFPRNRKDPVKAVSSINPCANVTSADENLNENKSKMNWELFGEIINSLTEASGKEEFDMSSMSNATKLKAEVERNLNILTAVDALCASENIPCDDGGYTFQEFFEMLDELKQLSSSFDTRAKKHGINLQSMQELLKSLQLKRSKLEPFLNQTTLCYSVAGDKASESSIIDKSQPEEVEYRGAEEGEKASDSSNFDKSQTEEVEHNEAEEASELEEGEVKSLSDNVASKTQSVGSNQKSGSNKGKGNSKAKKGKKGKGGKNR